MPAMATEAQVVAKVRKMDKATADHFNEVRMFSGEYTMIDGVAVSVYEVEQLKEINQQTQPERNTL
jgi:ribosome recycling factor